jgi:hypothetical protein
MLQDKVLHLQQDKNTNKKVNDQNLFLIASVFHAFMNSHYNGLPLYALYTLNKYIIMSQLILTFFHDYAFIFNIYCIYNNVNIK